MRAKVFSFLKLHRGSVIPSVRIARFVSEELQIPLCDDHTIGDEPLDMFLLVNGAFAFCNFLPAVGAAVKSAKRVVFIHNDYTIIIPKEESGAESPFRKGFRDRKTAGLPRADMWTTCASEQHATLLSHHINWNCLSFAEVSDDVIKERRKNADSSLFYYGSFRANRKEAFDRYFARPETPVVISSPSNKFEKLYQHGNVSHQKKIDVDQDFLGELGRHGLGLYLEDKRSHSEYHSTPNRFYEMLCAGLPMVFQPECGASLRKGGYDPTPYVVGNARHIKRMMEDRSEILKKQREDWIPRARAEREELPKRLHAAWAKLTDTL